MNRAFWLKISFVLALSAALVALPESSFAQRGGFHGGGGGFHSGGGGFHGGGGGFHGGGGSGFRSGGFGGSHGGGGFGGFRGGRSFGSFHNGGFNGFRGGRGFGGFRGDRDFDDFRGDRFFRGFGGFPFFADFDFGFGFWPYWGAYPYWYGYGPGWGPNAYSPYGYPDDPYDAPPDRYRGYDRDRRDRDNRCRPDYRHPDNGCNDGSPDTSKPSGENPPPRPSNTFEPESSPGRNYVTTNFADSDNRIVATTAVASNYQLANSTTQQVPSTLRPAVRNVIQALRAMPPDARKRQFNSGRYDSFSPEERELLNNASQSPQAE